jgi:hypothetical protein
VGVVTAASVAMGDRGGDEDMDADASIAERMRRRLHKSRCVRLPPMS